MAKKAKAGDKVKLGKWKDEDSLMIVDVSAHMRTNDAGDLKENEEMENLFYDKTPPKFQRKVLSTEVNGEEMVVTSLFKLMDMFRMYGLNHTWVFAFDVGGSLLKKIDKNYKANRVKMGHYYFDQVNTARKLLEEAGFTVLSKKGYEADHCIEKAVVQNYDYYDKIGIFTNDHDLSYLVDEKVSWLNVKKTYADIHMDNYFQQNKCPYNAILLKKALVGDKSDNIPGVRGIGEKKFFKFLEYEGIYGENVRGREVEILERTDFLTEEQREMALHCWSLVEPKDFDIDATANDLVDLDVLQMAFKKYKFNSLNKIFEQYSLEV